MRPLRGRDGLQEGRDELQEGEEIRVETWPDASLQLPAHRRLREHVRFLSCPRWAEGATLTSGRLPAPGLQLFFDEFAQLGADVLPVAELRVQDLAVWPDDVERRHDDRGVKLGDRVAFE